MSWTRRQVLASLGVGSAHAILFACGGAQRTQHTAIAIDPEISSWLRDAVAVLQGAGFTRVHALAATKRRTTAAIDVLGAGVARSRSDGVVLRVQDTGGRLREQVTNDLSRTGVQAAVRALAGDTRPASVDFGPMPAAVERPTPDPLRLSDSDMLGRVAALVARDSRMSSRIVYAASLLDVEDSHVWSVAPGRLLEQRLVRVRRSVTRVAWHGSRPLVSEASRAWTGGIDAQDLTDEEIVAARDNVLVLMTPRTFEDGERAFVLEPRVAANVVDVALRALLTRDAQRRPEVARRIETATSGAAPSASVVSIVDDPTVSDAYGTFRFDDAGELARPAPLLDKGRIVGRIERALRPGHVGMIESMPSHLRVTPGEKDREDLLVDGFLLEEPVGTIVDPSSDRVVVQVSRAREWLAKKRTGRLYADIEIVAELGPLLASLTDLSRQTQSIGIRDEVDSQPRHRSVETPWLLGRALLRQRRRST